jgi:signal transduction histidine kinase
MVYYLVLLFSIWAIVGLALSRWSRDERRGIVPRLLVAGALMSFGRLVFFVIALIDRQTGTHLVRFGPPLERFIDMLSAMLICWAFVLTARQRIVGQVFIGVTVFFAVGLYVIAAMHWVSVLQSDDLAFHNLSWQRWAWELGQLFILIPALVYLFVRPIPERGMLAVSLSVLIFGHLLQAIVPFPEQIPHFAGWVRFANLLVFPLLAVSSFRLIVQRFDAQAAELQAVSQESLSQITGLMDLLDVNQKMYSSLELDDVLDNATRCVSQTMQTNLCALALVSPDKSETVTLPIVYNAPDTIKNALSFQRDTYPAIQYAITRNKPIVLAPSESRQVAEIYRLLGSEQKGPVIVQPLAHESTVSGLTIVCRPGQPTPFSAVEARKCETLATHIATALKNAHRCQHTSQRIEQQVADLRLLEMEHTRTKADLENRLAQKQKEIALYVQKLYETELSEQRAQNDAQQARQQMKKLKTESQEIIDQGNAVLEDNMQQVALLTREIADLDAERLELNSLIKTLEQEKDQARQIQSKEADARTRARDEFLASLAQELRTPMTSILGYTDLLMSESVGHLAGIQRKFLQRVQANIERMGGMLNDMIGVTAIDSGKLVVELEPVDMVRVIESALRRAQFRLEEKELNTHLEIGELPVIYVDPDSVQQMVDNLLTNSCKSSLHGTTIGIRAHVESDDTGSSHLHVSVSDTGGGIAPEDRARAFERFYRADNALIAGLGETGVGLAIVKVLVEAHQGHVWLESEMGQGTTFHFRLPFGLREKMGNSVQGPTVARWTPGDGNGHG